MAYDRFRTKHGVTIRPNAADILKRAHGVSDEDIRNGVEAISHVTGRTLRRRYEGDTVDPKNEAAEIVLAFLGDQPKN